MTKFRLANPCQNKGHYNAVVTPLRKVATYEPRISHELRDINEDVHVNAP